MFVATGLAARQKSDGTIEVKVRIDDDRVVPPRKVKEMTLTGPTLPDVKVAAAAELDALRVAELDAALNQAVVGKQIAKL